MSLGASPLSYVLSILKTIYNITSDIVLFRLPTSLIRVAVELTIFGMTKLPKYILALIESQSYASCQSMLYYISNYTYVNFSRSIRIDPKCKQIANYVNHNLRTKDKNKELIELVEILKNIEDPAWL